MYDAVIFTDVTDTVTIYKAIGAYKIANTLRQQGYSCLVVDHLHAFTLDEIKEVGNTLDKLSELRSNDLELLLDKSAFKNETVHYLPLNHVDSCITTFYYSVNPKSKIKLVIEGTYEMDDDKITNKYQNFIPTNFYFEVQTEITDFELLNNDDLNVFLSVLN